MTLRPLWGLVCIGIALSNFSPGVAVLMFAVFLVGAAFL